MGRMVIPADVIRRRAQAYDAKLDQAELEREARAEARARGIDLATRDREKRRRQAMAEQQRDRRQCRRQAQLRRCTGCGDWLYGDQPCTACPGILQLHGYVPTPDGPK